MTEINIKIPITEQHIKQGVPGNCEHCPLAIALREYEKIDLDNIIITIKDIRYEVWEYEQSIEKHTAHALPSIKKFITNFDEGKHNVKPGTLYIKNKSGGLFAYYEKE